MNERHGGSVPARRAIVRWAGRLLRREWRQHVLVVAMMTVAVAAAVGFICAGHNLATASGQREFGTADHFYRYDDLDTATLTTTLDAARQWFGAIDTIGHRSVPVPGSTKNVDLRVQDPGGPYGRPLLALRSGRYPVTAGEVGVTRWVASTMGVRVGDAITLDGATRSVVGVVENPSDLDDHFVLLDASALTSSSSVTMLVDASEEQIRGFHPGLRSLIIGGRDGVSEEVVAAVITLVVTTLVLFLVALVAAASFTVIAQRRLPQLGMLAAVGATPRHVRLSLVATGAGAGLAAGLVGAVLGTGGWLVAAPWLEPAVGHRIDAANVPWWLVASGVGLSVLAATGAAWWPGRTASRVPPVLALSGRPPAPGAVERSAFLALAFLAGGAAALTYGSHTSRRVTRLDALAIVGGIVALAVGVLLLCPLAVRGLARLAGRAPVTVRLALRDLGRSQARAGAALAAISLAIALPVTIIASAASAENGRGPGNLASDELLVHWAEHGGPFVPDEATIDDLRAGADAIAVAVGATRVTELEVPVGTGAPGKPGLPGRPGVSVARTQGDGFEEVGLVYVATPETLALVGMNPLPDGADIVTAATGELRILAGPPVAGPTRDVAERLQGTGTVPSTYTSLPQALITPERVVERGWTVRPAGRWVIETDQPLTAAQRSLARDVAARAGLHVESRDSGHGLANLRNGAAAVGTALALGVLAMTVGLMRGEASGELRTLTATGATRATRRRITAATAGALAALGALLGTAGAYLALAAGRLEHLAPLPLGDLGLIALGTPLVAGAASWLVSGREPGLVARRPIG